MPVPVDIHLWHTSVVTYPADRHQGKSFIVRADEVLLEDFDTAVSATDSDRNSTVRRFMAWFARHPDAELPERP